MIRYKCHDTHRIYVSKNCKCVKKKKKNDYFDHLGAAEMLLERLLAKNWHAINFYK